MREYQDAPQYDPCCREPYTGSNRRVVTKESSLQLVIRELNELCELLSITRDTSEKLFPFIITRPETSPNVSMAASKAVPNQYPPVYEELLATIRRAKYLTETINERLVDAEL